ncbi:MAG: MBL fold metallo-hydrolase [bacterium]
MKKKISYLVGLILGFLILLVAQMPDTKAKMVVCDVGQGEAILFIKGSTQVLIDGGPSSEKILSCLEEYVPFYDRTIELIVLTNTDFDHINGLSAVIDRYQVIQFVTADGVHSSVGLDKFIEKLMINKIVVHAVERGDRVIVQTKQGLDKLEFRVLWPSEVIEQYVAVFSDQMQNDERKRILGASAKRGDLNERSVALLLLEDNQTILLMGDAGDQAEKEMVKSGDLPDADILKVGHHGSKYASTLEFLEKVRPELAVISVGAKNTYGHPTKETLEQLSKIGAVVRRTDLEGTIEIVL